MTIAHDLLVKIRPLKIKGQKSQTITKSADQLLQDFSAQIKFIKNRHVRKISEENYYVSSCFGKMRLLKNDVERNAFCRSHLVLADRCFDNLLIELKGDAPKISFKKAVSYGEIITDYIFDLKPIIEYLEQRKDPSFVFLRGHKNVGVATWELYRLSKQLAVQSAHRKTPMHFDHKNAQIVAVFALRQALEEKFFRLIAVAFYDAVASTPKIKHFFHYDFIISHPSYFTFKSVDFKLLKKIYEWCNEVVHNVYQPMAWQTS